MNEHFKPGKLYRVKSDLPSAGSFPLTTGEIVMCLNFKARTSERVGDRVEFLHKKKILAGLCGNILIRWFEELP